MQAESAKQKIYEVVKNIPYGKVATYGQVARLAGNEKMSRVVGNVLHNNPDPDTIPCFRVVNAQGKLSSAFAFGGLKGQEARLQNEGIEVTEGKVDLKRYQWKA